MADMLAHGPYAEFALLLIISAVAGAIAVGLGAFGAHGLRGVLTPDMLAVFETGVRYQMYHALALEDALALIDLGGNPFLQLVEGRKVAHLRIAFHLDQVASDRSGVQIQVEQSQVGALQTECIIDIV